MNVAERHDLIIDQARSLGRVEVTELATTLDCATETIRRDLRQLDERGLLRRVHGGAVPIVRRIETRAIGSRREEHAEEKGRIALAAVAELPVSGAILLDASSSSIALAEVLPAECALTVITNSLAVAQVLWARADLSLYVLGGRVDPVLLAQTDAWAFSALADVHADVGFFGTTGVSARDGLTRTEIGDVALARAMMAASRRRVVLADASKVGTSGTFRWASLADVDVLVTDDRLDDESAAEIVAAGPRLVRA
jgi:DeoR family transcriptional regulator, fructose operon transcriptional repressor